MARILALLISEDLARKPLASGTLYSDFRPAPGVVAAWNREHIKIPRAGETGRLKTRASKVAWSAELPCCPDPSAQLGYASAWRWGDRLAGRSHVSRIISVFGIDRSAISAVGPPNRLACPCQVTCSAPPTGSMPTKYVTAASAGFKTRRKSLLPMRRVKRITL